MIYVDYVILKTAYDESFRRINELINRKEEAFTRTLPGAIRYDLPKVIKSPALISKLDEYIADNEKIEAQIREARIISDERKYMLMQKAEELKTSPDDYDRVFVMYYLRRLPAEYIASMLDYSVDSIYYKKRKMEARMEQEGISLRELFNRR